MNIIRLDGWIEIKILFNSLKVSGKQRPRRFSVTVGDKFYKIRMFPSISYFSKIRELRAIN